MKPPSRRRVRLGRLAGDTSGLALVEFALSLPLLMILMSTGLEMTNYVVTSKRVGEIAVMVADNASRMGAQNVSTNKPISEAEINDVFTGANLQGARMNLPANARIILSSLQPNGTGGQTIKWQRCFGALNRPSAYGVEGVGRTDNSFSGMGPSTNRVTAANNTAVMVVEISYSYQRFVPIVSLPFREIRDFTAFYVRDDRDLANMPRNDEGVAVSRCS